MRILDKRDDRNGGMEIQSYYMQYREQRLTLAFSLQCIHFNYILTREWTKWSPNTEARYTWDDNLLQQNNI